MIRIFEKDLPKQRPESEVTIQSKFISL